MKKQKRPLSKLERQRLKSRRITRAAHARIREQRRKRPRRAKGEAKTPDLDNLINRVIAGAITGGILGLLGLRLSYEPGEFRPPQEVAIPKSRRIGKENPSDVVIDVKPERAE